MFDDYMDSQKAFENGLIDGFFVTYNDAILLAAEGYPLNVVYVADFSNGGDTIVSSPNITEIADLRGKTIGIAVFDGFSHLFVLDLLRANGISEDEVDFFEISEYDLVDLLDSGEIDAGHAIEPFHSMALDKGYNFLASSADIPGSIIDVLVIREDFVEDNPEVVQGVVDGLFMAERYLVENPEKAYSYISKKTGVGPYELNEELKGIKILNEEENKNIFNKEEDDCLYEKGEFIVDFYLERGVIERSLDLDELLDSRFVLDKCF